jgi:SanA protein
MKLNLKIVNIVRNITILIILSLLFSNFAVEIMSKSLTYNNTEDIPHNKVGVVLGTTKYVATGVLNPYYIYRIDAAEELYKADKVDFLLVSGDNGQVEYNEPILMKNDLVSRGIPEEKIFLDYAGFRTLDSIIRSREVFGQESITLISQEFHNKRAIFIARVNGIAAVGYNAKDVSYNVGLKTNTREVFARVKMMIDFIVNKQPKYLGEKIEIN